MPEPLSEIDEKEMLDMFRNQWRCAFRLVFSDGSTEIVGSDPNSIIQDMENLFRDKSGLETIEIYIPDNHDKNHVAFSGSRNKQ
ncbi:MAG: hypothetical protein K9L85_03100 [Candidatus Peribacteraceae bacterium]|nr:hypothetical protein [Candidatus Peribacteraceae bacterium]